MERGGETKELKIAQGAAFFPEIILFFSTQLFHFINRIIYLFLPLFTPLFTYVFYFVNTTLPILTSPLNAR